MNTITLGGGHKVQAIVQEVSAVIVWKEVWKSVCGLFLQQHFPQYISNTLLSAGKDNQSGQWPAVCDKTLPLICNFNSAESVALHNTPQQLGIS